jgi:hypothetical protein
LREALTHRSDTVRIGVISGKAPIRISRQHREELSQHPAIEGGVGLLGEVEQLLTRVSAGHCGGIDVEEVPRFRPG